MKEWTIPVVWEMCGYVKIKANYLADAMKIAVTDNSIPLPKGDYVDASFGLSSDDEDFIRFTYNNNEADHIGNRKFCAACGSEIDPDGCTIQQYGPDVNDTVMSQLCDLCSNPIEKTIRSDFNDECEYDFDDEFNEDYYTPSCTAGDYSPSCPWNAPGMSIKDFI